MDDDTAVARLLADLLSDAGYRAQIAEDGLSALRVIAASPPALVVLDLTLPGMSGREVLDRVRRTDAPKIPVVVINANPFAQDLLTEGANVVLIKPVAFDELLACIAVHIAAG